MVEGWVTTDISPTLSFINYQPFATLKHILEIDISDVDATI